MQHIKLDHVQVKETTIAQLIINAHHNRTMPCHTVPYHTQTASGNALLLLLAPVQ